MWEWGVVIVRLSEIQTEKEEVLHMNDLWSALSEDFIVQEIQAGLEESWSAWKKSTKATKQE